MGDNGNKSVAERWIQRLITEYHQGNVREAILLVKADPKQRWFLPLWEFPICFAYHRVYFDRPNLSPECCLSNFGAFLLLHKFSSNWLRLAYGADKRHLVSDESRQVTFLCLFYPFSSQSSRAQKQKTSRFQTQFFSLGAQKQPEKRHHFLPINFRRHEKDAFSCESKQRKTRISGNEKYCVREHLFYLLDNLVQRKVIVEIRKNIDSNNTEKHQFGTAFVYLGPNEDKFASVFQRFGTVARRITPKDSV